MSTRGNPVSDIDSTRELRTAYDALRREIATVIIGQDEIVQHLLIALLARGHCLLVGVPGLAKTLLIRTLARVLDLSFSRIQFTPDLMPSDITGTEIIEQETAAGRKAFKFIRGPVFANILLADEINRTPPKTQAALLEAMQEHRVTVGQTSYALPEPFFVLATQNPIEQEGTYPLPEAQVDRFMLKLKVVYPSRKEEREILDRMATAAPDLPVRPVVRPEQILRARDVVRQLYVDEKLKDYVVNLVYATRKPAEYGLDLAPLIAYGASPRATIFLVRAAMAHAFMNRRGYVIPEDIKAVAMDVLRHRVILSYEAESEELTSEDIITRVFDKIPVP